VSLTRKETPAAPVAPGEVRLLREAGKLSVDELAATLGVGAGEVRAREAGRLRVGHIVLRALDAGEARPERKMGRR
jgi:DNA-binding transcriptional regulator YiaG